MAADPGESAGIVITGGQVMLAAGFAITVTGALAAAIGWLWRVASGVSEMRHDVKATKDAIGAIKPMIDEHATSISVVDKAVNLLQGLRQEDDKRLERFEQAIEKRFDKLEDLIKDKR